jgi:hypothetical protein
MSERMPAAQLRRGLLVATILFGFFGLLNLGLYVRQSIGAEVPSLAWSLGTGIGFGAALALLYARANMTGGDKAPRRVTTIIAVAAFVTTSLTISVCLMIIGAHGATA